MSLTLNEVIERLTATDQAKPVFMEAIGDDGTTTRTVPEPDVHSWRGSYNRPSVDPFEGEPGLTVQRFRAGLAAAVGQDRGGYKGGEYTMRGDDDLWADRYGDCPGFSVVAVREDDDAVVLVIAKGVLYW